MFKRKAVKTREELPRNLVAAGTFQTRRVYGTGEPTSEPRANVYTPQGHFVQHADSFQEEQTDTFNALSTDIINDVEGVKPGKKARQFQRWEGEILPALMQPYIQLLRGTDSLRNMSEVRQLVGCSGCHSGRSLSVACIFFESGSLFLDMVTSDFYWAEIETLTLCTCTSPALQLLQRGLFPCAPLLPSLAVDLNMLEFVNELFVNAAPNTTAWCETLESFLGNRRYKLSTQVSFQFYCRLF